MARLSLGVNASRLLDPSTPSPTWAGGLHKPNRCTALLECFEHCDESQYTEAAFNLSRIGSSQKTLQIIVPIVKAGQVTATRTVIHRRNAVLYGTR